MNRLLSTLLIFFLVAPFPVCGEDVGRIEGGAWKYAMSKVEGKGTRAGRLHIQGEDIFQDRDGELEVIGKIVDKPPEGNRSSGKGDKVKVTFEALRGDDKKDLKLEGTLEMDSGRKVHGRFVDADGAHWTFRATRVEEK